MDSGPYSGQALLEAARSLAPQVSAAADETAAVHQYGQAAILARELPARDLMAALITETAECLATLARGRQR